MKKVNIKQGAVWKRQQFATIRNTFAKYRHLEQQQQEKIILKNPLSLRRYLRLCTIYFLISFFLSLQFFFRSASFRSFCMMSLFRKDSYFSPSLSCLPFLMSIFLDILLKRNNMNVNILTSKEAKSNKNV